MCELTLNERSDACSGIPVASASGRRASDKGILPLSLEEYLELLDASGRMVQVDKTGSIPDNLAPILERLGIQVDYWYTLVSDYHEMFGHIVGTVETLTVRATAAARHWYRGKVHCANAFF